MPSSLPSFRIVNISVAASYDELDPKLDPRPTPQSLNDLLFQKVCESVDLATAEDALQNLTAVEGADAKAAVLEFKPKIVNALNDAKIDQSIVAFELGGVTPYYRHTSSGTHEAVSWIMVEDANGNVAKWQIDLEVDGSAITTSVALSVFVSEVTNPARPISVAPTHLHEGAPV